MVRETAPSRLNRGGMALAIALFAAAPQLAAREADLVYPAAPRSDATDDYFGTTVADPYRWLETVDTPQAKAWVDAEDRLADDYFASLPEYQAMRAQVDRFQTKEKFSPPLNRGGRIFYTSNDGTSAVSQDKLYTADKVGGKERVVVDPNSLSDDGSLTVLFYQVDRDGRTAAYGVTKGGSDWTEWRFRDVATGRDLPDVLPPSLSVVPIFSADGLGFFYTARPPADGTGGAPAGLASGEAGSGVFYHAFGTPIASDRAVFSLSGAGRARYEPVLTSDGGALFVNVDTREGQSAYIVNLKDGSAKPVALLSNSKDHVRYLGTRNGEMFLTTTVGAPRGRVVAVRPDSPSSDRWRDVVAENDDILTVNIPWTRAYASMVDNKLLLRYRHHGDMRLAVFSLEGALLRNVKLPGLGIIRGFDGLPGYRDTYFTFQNSYTPPTVYRLDLRTLKATVAWKPRLNFNPADFESVRLRYPAQDGTKIPLLLAYKKGIDPKGRNPVVLWAYGAHGVPTEPTFDGGRAAWLSQGGVLAFASPRGGGEYGEPWRLAAAGLTKEVTFNDIITGAEWLIANNYSAKGRIGMFGMSTGGVSTAAVTMLRPDLFGAAVPHSGIYDFLRYQHFRAMGDVAVDYGVSTDPAQFEVMRRWSPQQNVKAGTAYPPMLLITAEHDTNAAPLHSYKFGAALQAATSSRQPILIRTWRNTGHGTGLTPQQAADQGSLIYGFMAAHLGLKVTP